MKEDKNSLPVKLSRPAQRALHNAGISKLPQLSKFSEKEIAKLHGVGPNAIVQLKKALADAGLSFAIKE